MELPAAMTDKMPEDLEPPISAWQGGCPKCGWEYAHVSRGFEGVGVVTRCLRCGYWEKR
jgi:hypothetical protein